MTSKQIEDHVAHLSNAIQEIDEFIGKIDAKLNNEPLNDTQRASLELVREHKVENRNKLQSDYDAFERLLTAG